MSFLIAGGVIAAAGAGIKAFGASKAEKRAKRKEKKARKEMEKLKNVYRQLDTSNPYLNMENVMEDLTINQRQFDLQGQQFAQSQANILSGLSEAAGSSGLAGVAQALAGQGQLAAQQSAAGIGAQERQNQMAERQMASQIQSMERQGEVLSRQMERDKQATLLGMSQQDVAAYREQAAAANQAKWGAISEGVGAIGGMMTGMAGAGGSGGGGMMGGGGSGGGVSERTHTQIALPGNAASRFWS